MEFSLRSDNADGFPVIEASGPITEESLYRTTPAYTNEVGRSIRVAYNRGGLLEVFEPMEDAVAWLQKG